MSDDQEERIEKAGPFRKFEEKRKPITGTELEKVTWFPENLNKKEYPRSVLNMHNLLEQVSRLNDKINSNEAYWKGIVATKIEVHNNYVDSLEGQLKASRKLLERVLPYVKKMGEFSDRVLMLTNRRYKADVLRAKELEEEIEKEIKK